jgi:hypothetical protein
LPGRWLHEQVPDHARLGEEYYNGLPVPDHVPRCGDNDLANWAGEAYIFGYIRAMIQAVDTELGRRA